MKSGSVGTSTLKTRLSLRELGNQVIVFSSAPAVSFSFFAVTMKVVELQYIVRCGRTSIPHEAG